MLRRAAVVLASRPVLLPSAPALLAPLAIQCLAPQLRPRGLAKKAVKEKSSKGGKGKSDEDNEDEDGAGPAAGFAGEGPDLDKLAAQMERSLGILLKEYHGMQVGRASPGMLDSIQVSTPNGGSVPLSSVGKALAQSARLLQVSVFDAANVNAVAKAIEASGMHLTPEVSGKTVKVNLPRPTAESREALRREVRRVAEIAKTALRAARQKAMKKAKAMPSKDDVKRAEKEVDKVTDGFTDKVDREVAKKEAEVMEV